MTSRPALLDETGSFTSSTLASRLSKTFNLMGGALAIDAGCASSLAALHSAADLLRSGACDTVLCAAAQRALDRPAYEELALLGWLSSARTDTPAFTPGEGVVLLLLRRLSDARRDGDRVLAVIDDVRVAPASTSPPDDLTHLTAAIGHTQATHGLAAVLQASLQLEALDAPPTRCTLTPDPLGDQTYRVELANLAAHNAVADPRETAPSRIYRFGAVNLAALCESLAQPHVPTTATRTWSATDRVRLTIVADTPAVLTARMKLAAEHLTQTTARAVLEEQGIYCREASDSPPRIALLFPGQGSQYPGMLRSLVETSPAARAALVAMNASLVGQGQPTFEELAWRADNTLGADVTTTQVAMLVANRLV